MEVVGDPVGGCVPAELGEVVGGAGANAVESTDTGILLGESVDGEVPGSKMDALLGQMQSHEKLA
jgi:hypothetical protein